VGGACRQRAQVHPVSIAAPCYASTGRENSLFIVGSFRGSECEEGSEVGTRRGTDRLSWYCIRSRSWW